MNVLLPLRDGSTPSTIPVTASGLSQASALGRSPKPLPKSRAGLKTSKDSAPIFARPVPPASQPKATEKMVSCSALVKNWYLSVSSRLPKPLSVLPLAAGSRRVQSPPKVRPRLGKIRLENSPETVVFWRAGVSPSRGSLMWNTVGSESSSATKGSSMVRVDGKKRLPATAQRGPAPRATCA